MKRISTRKVRYKHDTARVSLTSGNVRIYDYDYKVTSQYYEAFNDDGNIHIKFKPTKTKHTKKIFNDDDRLQFHIGYNALMDMGFKTDTYEFSLKDDCLIIFHKQ